VQKFVTIGDASVGKSSSLVRLTDQRSLTNADATVSTYSSIHMQPMASWVSQAAGKGGMTTLGFGVESGSKLTYIPDEDKAVKLQCACSISTSTVNF